MPQISIIIPVFNTEAYLEKCLDSVINQTYQDYEIIIVDDGSTDTSPEIIAKYAQNYKDKIFVYRKKNEGVSIARNYGIEKSRGRFITFVDSDDYIDKNMLKEMIEKASENDFDMVICNLLYIYPNKEIIGRSGISSDLLDKNQIRENMINILPAMCGKLIKRDLYKNVNFKPNIWFEDVESYFRMYPNLNKIGIVNSNLYFYPQRSSSITYTYNEKLYDIVNIWDDIIKYYKENKFYEQYRNELEYSTVRYCYATFIKRLAKTKDKKIFKAGVNYAIKHVNTLFPEYKSNTYLKSFTPKNLYLKHFNKAFAYLLFYITKIIN